MFWYETLIREECELMPDFISPSRSVRLRGRFAPPQLLTGGLLACPRSAAQRGFESSLRSQSLQQLTATTKIRVGSLCPFLCLSFAKTGAALLPVTIATSRQLIAPMIAMVGRPERSDVTYVRSAVSGI